jgi:hypothetical protein
MAAQSAEDGSECFSVFRTDAGEILPANFIGVKLSDAKKQKYPDYQEMGTITQAGAPLLLNGGQLTPNGYLVAKELGIRPDATGFRTFALDNMFCKIYGFPQIKIERSVPSNEPA